MDASTTGRAPAKGPWFGLLGFARRAVRRELSPVVKFAASGLAVVVLVGVAITFILRDIGRDEAIRDARSVTQILGLSVVEPVLDEGLVTGDPEAFRRVDEMVREYVLGDQVMRVKIWEPSGRIVYSDEERLVGSVYPTRAEDLDAFTDEGAVAEISDLSRPENRFERSADEVLEVYFPVHLPDGEPLMFEAYLRLDAVAQTGNRIWFAFLAALVGGLIFLWLVQIPLAWSMTRRMRKAQQEREAMLRRAIESSNLERLRIAADLHDGVVQDLVGVSYSVRAMADRIAVTAPPDVTSTLQDSVRTTKQAVRRMRTLLVEIYPPNLRKTGLLPALLDLIAPLEARGMRAQLDVPEDLRLPDAVEALLFRAAQESLRNVARHSGAGNVSVQVRVEGDRALLTIVDDGRGFDIEGAGEEGHFGVRLLADLARDANGNLDLSSVPGEGTTIRLEMPL